MSAPTPTSSLAFQNFFSATLTSDITSSATDIPMDAIPNGTEGFLVIEPDSTTAREVIYYNSKTATKVTCPDAASGRGQDDTTASSHLQGSAVIMAPVAAFYEALQNFNAMPLDVKGGWVNANPSTAWTYSSYDSTNKTGVITVPSGATSKFSNGMRVRFTNNGSTQYGIITAVASTTLTVYFGTDYSLTNAAITVPYYSVQKAPLGFPLDPAKWTVTTTGSSTCAKSNPTAGTWYGDTGLSATGPSISVPIGAWDLRFESDLVAQKGAATTADALISLSTSASSETDTDMTARQFIGGASGTLLIATHVTKRKTLVLTAATTYYLIIKTSTSSMTSITMDGAAIPIKIKAVCAYI